MPETETLDMAALRSDHEETTQALREICHEYAELVGSLMMAGLVVEGEGRRWSYRWEAQSELPAGPSGEGCYSFAAAVSEALMAVRRAVKG